MDTFLQLDTGGVYDDDDLDISAPVDLETQIQRHVVETSPTETLFGDQPCPPVVAGEEVIDTEHEQLAATDLDKLERQHFYSAFHPLRTRCGRRRKRFSSGSTR